MGNHIWNIPKDQYSRGGSDILSDMPYIFDDTIKRESFRMNLPPRSAPIDIPRTDDTLQ
jgi:hypothetical protein